MRDASGAAIGGASVRLHSRAGVVRLAATGGAGRFRFDDLPFERATIVVDAPSFERAVVDVAAGTEATVQLSVRALAQEVTVTATGSLEDLDASPRAAWVMSREQLDRRLEISVAEALREVPGVRVTQSGGPGALANIRIRGLRQQDTAVLIDGMRLRDPAATQGDASAFVAELMPLNLDRLEVMRGGGSALYGSHAMAGVVNLITGTGGGGFRGDWLGEGGGLGFFRSQARVSGGDRFTYSTGAGHINVSEGVDGDDPSRISNLQGAVRYAAKPGLVLSARLMGANSFLGLNTSPSLTANAPSSGPVTAIPLGGDAAALRDRGLPFAVGPATVLPGANDPDSHRITWMTSVLFAADHQLTPRWNYRVAYQLLDARKRFPNGPGGPGFQPLASEVSTFNGRVDTLQGRVNHSGARNLFSAGAEWERETFDNGGVSRSFGPEEAYRARVAQRSVSAYGEDRLLLLRTKLQVTLSGRWQGFSLSRPRLEGGVPAYRSEPLPSPPEAFTGDASVMYRVERSQTKLRAHLGNAYRAPSLFERYGAGYFGGVFTPYGDPRLSPERSVGGDAGIDQYIGARRARVSVTYFYTQLRSVIGFDFSGLINRTTDPFGRGSGYFNTAGGLARGVELEAQAALWRGFQVTGSYTHTRTLERLPVALGTLRSPRIYAHTAAFAATQSWRRLTVTGNLLYAPEYLGIISGRAVLWPGPRRLDMTAAYRVGEGRWRPELFIRVENLLGNRYYEDGFRTPRRWAVGGLRVGF